MTSERASERTNERTGACNLLARREFEPLGVRSTSQPLEVAATRPAVVGFLRAAAIQLMLPSARATAAAKRKKSLIEDTPTFVRRPSRLI